jgi:hypothetical protein
MIDFPMEVVMILAWLLHRRTRQAARRSSFSRRKPVVVATAPSAPLSSQQKPPSRSLRSARRQPDEYAAGALRGTRDRLLRVRLTEQEAEQVASRAKARKLSLSDFVRRAVLRGTGARFSIGRRILAADDAATIRQLTDIAAGIRSLIAIALAQGNINENELQSCLTEVSSILARLSV